MSTTERAREGSSSHNVFVYMFCYEWHNFDHYALSNLTLPSFAGSEIPENSRDSYTSLFHLFLLTVLHFGYNQHNCIASERVACFRFMYRLTADKKNSRQHKLGLGHRNTNTEFSTFLEQTFDFFKTGNKSKIAILQTTRHKGKNLLVTLKVRKQNLKCVFTCKGESIALLQLLSVWFILKPKAFREMKTF